MHLLVATGGSRHSDIAAHVGLALAKLIDADVTLLYVVKHDAQRPAARRTLESLCDQPLYEDLHVRLKIRIGRPLTELNYELFENPADLLVIGERSPHRLWTRLRGSLVSRLTDSSPCPVLIAKDATVPYKRVLICDSGVGSPTVFDGLVEHGLLPLLALASKLNVLHVMSQISAAPGVRGRDLRAGADELIKAHSPEGELLARDLSLLSGQGLTADTTVRHGLVIDEILAEAADGDYDLIVIGGHRSGGWPALLLDDLAHQLVSRLDRSLLVVR